MNLNIQKTDLHEILTLRNLFLQENNFQIRYNSCYERGWTDTYIVFCNGAKIGYGSVRGNEKHNDRDSIFEFYLIPPFRNITSVVFAELLTCCGAIFIECQSNDFLLTSMLYQFAENIKSEVILFEDGSKTFLTSDKAIFRKITGDDVCFEHKSEPPGDFVLEFNEEIVATGGFLLHYNMPFADLYMEVKEPCRRKGFGSFIIQEIRKECYLAGRVPAARCNINNVASKMTLLKGGLKIAGYILLGNVK
ncbi:MAG TPA: hypothetical protein VKR53_21170 [Puia sp.]|nr:hypothetical protein [Puia sp.]